MTEMNAWWRLVDKSPSEADVAEQIRQRGISIARKIHPIKPSHHPYSWMLCLAIILASGSGTAQTPAPPPVCTPAMTIAHTPCRTMHQVIQEALQRDSAADAQHKADEQAKREGK